MALVKDIEMKNFDLFNELNEEEIDKIKSESKYIEIDKGSVLFYEDEICQEILYLTQGTVKLSMSTDSHEEVPLYDFCEGDQCIVNIASTISGTKAVATAVANTDIKGWLIPKKIIQELIIKSPKYQSFIFSLFAIRFSSLTTLVEDIKFKKLDSRILEFLKSYETNFISITHVEISIHLGTSRVVISRVLKDLENKGYLKLKRGKIELLKLDTYL